MKKILRYVLLAGFICLMIWGGYNANYFESSEENFSKFVYSFVVAEIRETPEYLLFITKRDITESEIREWYSEFKEDYREKVVSRATIRSFAKAKLNSIVDERRKEVNKAPATQSSNGTHEQ